MNTHFKANDISFQMNGVLQLKDSHRKIKNSDLSYNIMLCDQPGPLTQLAFDPAGLTKFAAL